MNFFAAADRIPGAVVRVLHRETGRRNQSFRKKTVFPGSDRLQGTDGNVSWVFRLTPKGSSLLQIEFLELSFVCCIEKLDERKQSFRKKTGSPTNFRRQYETVVGIFAYTKGLLAFAD